MKEYPMSSRVVPVARQKEKIHGGDPNARVDLYGGPHGDGSTTKAPPGGSQGTVQTHDDAAAMHGARGKGKNDMSVSAPQVEMDRSDGDCPSGGGYGGMG